MEDFWSGLIGVVVGALVTFGSSYQQNRWERKRAKDVTAESIASGNRGALSRLAEHVASDVTSFKVDFGDMYASGSNAEVMAVADLVASQVSAAHDRARAVTSLVVDVNVASRADDVYNAWYKMLTTISEDIANAASRSGHDALVDKASREAPETFFAAVRAAVKTLDDERIKAA